MFKLFQSALLQGVVTIFTISIATSAKAQVSSPPEAEMRLAEEATKNAERAREQAENAEDKHTHDQWKRVEADEKALANRFVESAINGGYTAPPSSPVSLPGVETFEPNNQTQID